MDERFEEIQRGFEEFSKANALRLGNPSAEIEEYLNLSKEELNSMHPLDVAIAASLLAKHALHIQKVQNSHLRLVNWADVKIKEIICKSMSEQSASSAEERKFLAIQGNDAARWLSRQKVEHQQYVDELTMIAHRIEYYCKTLDEVKRVKLNMRHSQERSIA